MELTMIKDKYDELRNKYINFNEEYYIKIDTKNRSEIHIGLTKTKTPFFMFRASEYCNVQALRETAGYLIKTIPADDYFTKCKIEAKDKKSFEVFYIVIDDLIKAANKDENYDTAITKRLFMWEQFFKHTVTNSFTTQDEVGLLGELLFIEEQLEKKNMSIINAWHGPGKEVKDFIIEGNAIEIKTSTISTTNRVTISDENQLDDSGFSNLFLNVKIITQNQMNGRTVPEVIDNITTKLENAPNELNEFTEKLLRLGYNDRLRKEYNRKFELSKSLWYLVKNRDDQSFPRIIPEDLRKGVKFVKYQIELSDLDSFRIDDIDSTLNYHLSEGDMIDE